MVITGIHNYLLPPLNNSIHYCQCRQLFSQGEVAPPSLKMFCIYKVTQV